MKVLHHAQEQPVRSSYPAELAKCSCRHRRARSSVLNQAGSTAEIRHRYHLIDSYLLERVNENAWSLGDSNP